MTTSPTQLKDLLAILEELAASSLAESWDNVGLMVGDPRIEVSGVLVGLDFTEDILVEAEECGCNVVVTHHPLIFKPLQSVRVDQVTGRLLARALTSGIAVVSCHTNLDKVAGGVNDVLASRLGILDCRVLAVDPGGIPGVGFGRIGDLPEQTLFKDFAGTLLGVLEVPTVLIAGAVPRTISTVAVCGGSGSELAETAMMAGADLFITGEVKHSTARWAEGAGFCVIDGGHYATENLVVPGLVRSIADGCTSRGGSPEVVATKRQTSPFQFYSK